MTCHLKVDTKKILRQMLYSWPVQSNQPVAFFEVLYAGICNEAEALPIGSLHLIFTIICCIEMQIVMFV